MTLTIHEKTNWMTTRLPYAKGAEVTRRGVGREPSRSPSVACKHVSTGGRECATTAAEGGVRDGVRVRSPQQGRIDGDVVLSLGCVCVLVDGEIAGTRKGR